VRVKSRSTLAVAGGVYHERCARPHWGEVFGSGGRAASYLAQAKIPIELHAYADVMACYRFG
jgi:hypothetical protein